MRSFLKLISLSAIALALLLPSARSAAADTALHVVLSPWVEPAARAAQHDTIRRYLLEEAKPGSQLTLWDGWSLTTLGAVTVPTLRYDNAAARAQNRDVGRLLTDFKAWTATAAPAGNTLAGSAALRAPEVLQEIGATPAAGPRTILLVGSPLYHSPAEPAFDMATDARYPSDGHLALGLRDSVFGLAEKSGRLDRATVQWVYPTQSIWANELHRHSVTRFWTLFIQGQGGTLATFGADMRATLTRAVQPGLPPVLRVQPDPADEKPLMRSARPRSLPVWLETPPAAPPQSAVIAPPPVVEIPAPAVPPHAAVVPEPEPAPVVTEIAPPVAPRPIAVEAVIPPPTPSPIPMPHGFDSTKTGIGIAWHAAVDLDLHVRLRAGVKELYYHVDRTPEGRLYKDEQKANAGGFFEFVEFTGTGPVDLSRASVWVHFYSGRAKNVTGQVVLFDRGQIKTGTFSLRAEKGNGNDSTTQRATSPYWVEIHLTDLVETTAPLAARKPGGAK